MADSLEDDFVLSDVEEAVMGGGADGIVQSGEDSDLEERGTKRKQVSESKEEEETEEEKKARKKRKMKQQDKKRKANKMAANSSVKAGSLASMPPDMQADHLRKLVKSCNQFKKMTDLELDEIGIKESMLLDTTAITIERSINHIIDFATAAMPFATKEIKEISQAETKVTGQPALLVITGNAQRAADLAKALRKLDQPAKGEKGVTLPVAKLFARHFKIAEQEAFLKTSSCPMAVGTPRRVQDLLQSKSLNLTRLKAILLDASWTDAKMRTLIDGNETREDLCSLLACDEIQSRLKSTDRSKKAIIALF